jgi:soluble lytic murein transglycosylase-like protein
MLGRLKVHAVPVIATLIAVAPLARAAEHITLRNGFSLDCARREVTGDRVRLYLLPTAAGQTAGEATNYIEVSVGAILRAEAIPDVAPAGQSGAVAERAALGDAKASTTAALTAAELRQLLVRAGSAHNIDADLLASVVRAESNGDALAVSRAGARGLMQLMPATASELNVRDSFAPEENIGGGTAYLDQLLTRYHDNIALALAAYNAGPGAVDRYHGIPPYAETRAYVAWVIREFNRRKRAGGAVALLKPAAQIGAK